MNGTLDQIKSRPTKFAASVGAAWLLAIACWQTARRAYADYLFSRNTMQSVARAAAVEASNADYHAWLAELQEGAGQDPRAELERAAALRPTDAGVWIRLGLRAEVEGDYDGAEQELLRAAQVSRKYAPRWALANFYFRRGRGEPFWRWTREALAVSYSDRKPLFELCRRMERDADVVLRRAVPQRREVLAAYVSFLLAERDWAALEPLTISLAERAERGEAVFFLEVSDRLLAERRTSTAVGVWNALCARGLLPYSELSPERAAVVTNGDFGASGIGRGFDWRVAQTEGVFVEQIPGRWSVLLNGRQPERCEILSQWLPLEPGRKYRMRYRCKVAAKAAGTGLRWRVYASKLLGESEAFPESGVTEASFNFEVPAGETRVRLALVCERPLGSTRPEGTIALESAVMEPAE